MLLTVRNVSVDRVPDGERGSASAPYVQFALFDHDGQPTDGYGPNTVCTGTLVPSVASVAAKWPDALMLQLPVSWTGCKMLVCIFDADVSNEGKALAKATVNIGPTEVPVTKSVILKCLENRGYQAPPVRVTFVYTAGLDRGPLYHVLQRCLPCLDGSRHDQRLEAARDIQGHAHTFLLKRREERLKAEQDKAAGEIQRSASNFLLMQKTAKAEVSADAGVANDGAAPPPAAKSINKAILRQSTLGALFGKKSAANKEAPGRIRGRRTGNAESSELR